MPDGDQAFNLRLVGYRAFEDSGDIELPPGRTAFIGVNNAGKSSILRSFYETKPVFAHLAVVSVVPGDGGMIELLKHQVGIGPQLRPGERIGARSGRTPEVQVGLPPSPFGADDELWPTRLSLSFPAGATPKLRLWGPAGEYPTGPEWDWTGVVNVRPGLPNAPVYQLTRGDKVVDLTPVNAVAKIISKCFYVGAFRNAVNIGGLSNYYDLQLGEAFVKRYAEMKSGDDPAANEAVGRLMQDLARIFGYRQLEVNPDPLSDSPPVPHRRHEQLPR